MKTLLLLILLSVLLLPTLAAATTPDAALSCSRNAVLNYGRTTERSSYQLEKVYTDSMVKITYRLVHGFAGDTEFVMVRDVGNGNALVGRWVDGNASHFIEQDAIWAHVCGL